MQKIYSIICNYKDVPFTLPASIWDNVSIHDYFNFHEKIAIAHAKEKAGKTTADERADVWLGCLEDFLGVDVFGQLMGAGLPFYASKNDKDAVFTVGESPILGDRLSVLSIFTHLQNTLTYDADEKAVRKVIAQRKALTFDFEGKKYEVNSNMGVADILGYELAQPTANQVMTHFICSQHAERDLKEQGLEDAELDWSVRFNDFCFIAALFLTPVGEKLPYRREKLLAYVERMQPIVARMPAPIVMTVNFFLTILLLRYQKAA